MDVFNYSHASSGLIFPVITDCRIDSFVLRHFHRCSVMMMMHCLRQDSFPTIVAVQYPREAEGGRGINKMVIICGCWKWYNYGLFSCLGYLFFSFSILIKQSHLQQQFIHFSLGDLRHWLSNSSFHSILFFLHFYPFGIFLFLLIHWDFSIRQFS